VVREKTHVAAPMTLAQALYEMELVGHDFFLFRDQDSDQPSVVYRRKGYDYWQVGPNADSTTSWTLPFPPHWAIGGIFLTGVGSLVLGLVVMAVTWAFMPAFFRGETLPKRTAEELMRHPLQADR
jgi:hypothetical protein